MASNEGWTVSRLWNTGGALDALPLPVGTVRVIVGVDGTADVRLGEESVVLAPQQLILLDGKTPVTTENQVLWARCEWHLRSPALLQERFATHFSRPLAMRPGSYALFAAITNTISTTPDMGWSPGADLLIDALSGTVRAAVLDSVGGSLSLSVSQEKLFRDATAVIEARYVDRSFDVTALAETLHVSTRYLRTVFGIIGTTPRAAIETRRVEAAAVLLRAGHKRNRTSLEAVAHGSGFSSVARLQAALRRNTSPQQDLPGLRRPAPDRAAQ